MRVRPAALALAVLTTPAAAFASEEAEAGSHVFWEWANLLLLVAVLFYLTRRPVQNYLAERRARIHENLESSESLLREAEARLAEWSAKADRLEQDADEIKRLARNRAEQERQRIIGDAQRSAERIRRDATAAVDREVRRARQILREEAADLAIALAEQRLRENVTDTDRARLVEEFVSHVSSRERPNGGGATGAA